MGHLKSLVIFGVILTEMLHPKFNFQLGGLLEVQAENTRKIHIQVVPGRAGGGKFQKKKSI